MKNFPSGAARAAAPLSSALLLALLLAAPAPALAAAVEFGPEGRRLVADVPEGWEAAEADGALKIVSPDGETVLVVRLCPREGRGAEAPARRAARELAAGGVRKQDDRTWTFSAASEGVRVRNAVRATGDFLVVVSSAGDADAAQAVAASIRPKE